MDAFGAFIFVGYLISGAIIVQSLICRILFIQMTNIIKFKDDSRQKSFIIISVFSVFFLNYGVLWLLVPMKNRIPLLDTVFNGIFWDFN